MLAPVGPGELLPYDDDTIEHVGTQLDADGVHTLLVQFTDVHGVAKGKLVPLEQLHQVVRHGAGFAGPSIAGTGLPRTGPRSEFYARGELDSAQALPWMPGVARIVASGWVDGEPFSGCPRQVLMRASARLAARGWTLRTGIEPEFFLLRRGAADGSGWVPFDDLDRLDKPSYDLKSLPRQTSFLQALRSALESAGLAVEQIDHEDAHGQFELNFRHDEALRSADHLMLFKLAAHTFAEQRGAVFSMMPKPFANQPGSGLHVHASLWQHERCLFDAPDDAGGAENLSDLGRWFVGGVLHHAPALCALAAPTVNSYKRLTVGESLSGTTWAPAFVAHGPNNRTALVRTLPGRFEWRLPDASANPYLMLAGLIAAGLDGIDRRLDPGPATLDDLFELPAAQRRERGIAVLPQSLAEAVDALEHDAVLAEALGAELVEAFVQLKRDEWLAYARQVTPWEMARYAALF
jgi:glutamine synthetase